MLLYQCAKVWAVYAWIKAHPWQPKMAAVLLWGGISWWVVDWVFSNIDGPVFLRITGIALLVSLVYIAGIYRLGLIEYRSIWPKKLGQ